MRIAIRPLLLAACILVVLCAVGCGSKKAPSARVAKEEHQPTSKPEVAANSGSKQTPPGAKTPGIAPGTPKPTAGELIRQLQSAYRGMSSLKAEGVSETTVSADHKPVGKAQRENVSLIFKRPNKMVVDTPASRVTMDGKVVYNYSHSAKQYIKVPVTPAFVKSLASGKPGMGIMGLLYGTDYTKAIVSPKMLPDAKIGGHEVYVVSFGLKSGVAVPKGVSGTETLWIGKSDLGVYKNRVTLAIDTRSLSRNVKGANGKAAKVIETTTTNELTVFQPNAKVADSTFAFKPPSGAKLFAQPKLTSLLDKPAPDFSFTMADGTSRKLSDLRGKFVLLSFWALPMCDPQLPVLQSLSKALKSDTELVAINLNGDKAAVTEYLTKKGDTFPVVFADAQIAKVAGEQYGLRALPTTLILDKNGVVRAQFLGLVTQKQIEDRLNSIR